MKIPCSTVQDLLPLYLEDACSPETRTILDAHLKTCDTCARELGLMGSQTPKTLPHPDEVKITTATAKTIKRNHWQAVLRTFRLLLLFPLTLVVLFETLLGALLYNSMLYGQFSIWLILLLLPLLSMEDWMLPEKTPLDWVRICLPLCALVGSAAAMVFQWQHYGVDAMPCVDCGLHHLSIYVIPWLALTLLRLRQQPKDASRNWNLVCIGLILVYILFSTLQICFRFENFSPAYFVTPVLTAAGRGYLLWLIGKLFLGVRWMIGQAKETVRGQD